MKTDRKPGHRCLSNGKVIYPCFVVDGSTDYEGRCFGCGDKMVITYDEQNSTYDTAREYLIKEGLDPDQLAKEGTVFIKSIHERIRLEQVNKDLLEALEYCYDYCKFPLEGTKTMVKEAINKAKGQ